MPIQNTEAAQPNTEKFEYNGNQITAVTNLMIPGAYVAFNNADGGEKWRQSKYQAEVFGKNTMLCKAYCKWNAIISIYNT